MIGTERRAQGIERGIKLSSVRCGNHKTQCPRCSHTRKKKRDPCLSVTIDQEGVRYGLEVHPTEIAYDIVTTERALEAIGRRPAFGLNFERFACRRRRPERSRAKPGSAPDGSILMGKSAGVAELVHARGLGPRGPHGP